MQLEGELKSGYVPLSQRLYPGFLKGGQRIFQNEGFKGLYKGLSASLVREGSYSAIRLGLYDKARQLFGASDPSTTPLYAKIFAGACTGAIGSAIANPSDVVKIRMQADVSNTFNYSHILDGVVKIYKSEGLSGLWRGVGATTQRAALLTAAQIPSYDHSKYYLRQNRIMEEGFQLHFCCSMFAGLVTATVTSPIDVIKTRIMNSSDEGKLGTFQAGVNIINTEGIRGFYKGWFPNWMRIGPHTIITLLIFERLRLLAGIQPL
jgi:hypothetical protein